MFDKKIPQRSTTFDLAIHFGFIITQALRVTQALRALGALGALGKREKREIEFICSYVFL